MKRIGLGLVLIMLLQAAPAWSEPLRVVATFSVLADLTRAVGGDQVEVYSLVAPDQDAHAYEPNPSDAMRISKAQLAVVNGLGMEGWLERLVNASGFRGVVAVASSGVTPLTLSEPEDIAHDPPDHEHGHGSVDPHAWQDAGRAMAYVKNIRDALIQVDGEHATLYRENATRYLSALKNLDTEIKQSISKIPLQQRKVITSHDAFGYYGHAYGVTFIAPVGKSTESDATAGDIAALIRQIRTEKIRVLFVENISNTRIIERISQETGARMGGTLYSDALSNSKGPAGTYVNMMRHNTRLLVDAMVRP